MPIIITHVPDQSKSQAICDNSILENGTVLKSLPNCYKNQNVCNKAADNYANALK